MAPDNSAPFYADVILCSDVNDILFNAPNVKTNSVVGNAVGAKIFNSLNLQEWNRGTCGFR